MLGGSIALAAAAAASTVAVARAVVFRRRPSPLALFGTAATVLYPLVIRPWHLRWGAEPGGEERELPGNELLPQPFQPVRYQAHTDRNHGALGSNGMNEIRRRATSHRRRRDIRAPTWCGPPPTGGPHRLVFPFVYG
jgi:hypothetical protein